MEQIDPRKLLIEITGILERLSIPYIITGGIAVLVWGRPRFTADVDIVVELQQQHVGELKRALEQLGDAGYIDRRAMEEALRTEGEFNFIDGTTGVKVDFWILKNDEFDRSRIKRRREKEILGKTIYFTSPEDLILIKLLWHKESQSSRQIEDAESIIKISGKELDIDYLKECAKKLGVLDTLITLLEKSQ